MYDVIVVGAGPAGSIAARECARHGLNTLLIEKEHLPREKPCGGAVMFRGLKLIKGHIPKDIIQRPIHGLRFGFPNGSEAEFVAKKLMGITVDRAEFDSFLAHQAIDFGTEFAEGSRVSDVIVHSDYGEVILKDGRSIKSSLIIGADGVKSQVARSQGLRPERKPPEEVGLGMESDFYVGEDGVIMATGGRPYILDIRPARGRISYGWVFPKRDHLAIGVAGAAIHMHPLRDIFDEFCRSTEKRLGITLKIEKRRTHFLDGTGVLNENVADRIILAGDAAGFIDPMMGEGIAYAMKSGLIAARIASKAIEAGRLDKAYLSEYDRTCKREFSDHFHMAGWAASRGIDFAEFLLSRARGHHLANEIMAMVARGEIRYSDIPSTVVRRIPRELPSIIRQVVSSRLNNS